jgi:hypothetical protein
MDGAYNTAARTSGTMKAATAIRRRVTGSPPIRALISLIT